MASIIESSSEILKLALGQRSKLLRITLNRPKALNSLVAEQTVHLAKLMPAIASSNEISAVLLEGTGGRAFCAGADIKAVVNNNNKSDIFLGEYITNSWFAKGLNGKPIVALWRGIVMGGGVGLSIFANHRLTTDTVKFAMPETKLGLFPDVGAAFVYLERFTTPSLAAYVGLLSHTLNAADLLAFDFATKIVSEKSLEGLSESLFNSDKPLTHQSIAHSISSLEEPTSIPQPTLTKGVIEKVNHYFDSSLTTVSEVIAKLEAGVKADDTWAKNTLDELNERCPTSCVIWMKQLYELQRYAKEVGYDFRKPDSKLRLKVIRRCFETDYKLTQWCLETDPGRNLYEGARALLIDKTKDTKWHPKTFAETEESLKDMAIPYESLEHNHLGLLLPSII